VLNRESSHKGNVLPCHWGGFGGNFPDLFGDVALFAEEPSRAGELNDSFFFNSGGRFPCRFS
jgi:hypothetical protein